MPIFSLTPLDTLSNVLPVCNCASESHRRQALHPIAGLVISFGPPRVVQVGVRRCAGFLRVTHVVLCADQMPKAVEPDDLCCPISHELFEDPVVAGDGNSYERKSVTDWLAKGNSTSPTTRQPLPHLHLTPNLLLKAQVATFLQSLLSRQAFWNAVLSGDVKTLESKPYPASFVQMRDASGRTALMAAARAGHTEMVLFLLREGARINVTTFPHGSTALMEAVTAAKPQVVSALLEQGASLSISDCRQWSVLHQACHLHDETAASTIVPTLIAAGAALDARSSVGSTPFHYCSTVSAAAALLQAKADVCARNTAGDSVLHSFLLFPAQHRVLKQVLGHLDAATTQRARGAGGVSLTHAIVCTISLSDADVLELLQPLSREELLVGDDRKENALHGLMKAQSPLPLCVKRRLEALVPHFGSRLITTALNAQNAAGDTPLHVALNQAPLQIDIALVDLLLSLGNHTCCCACVVGGSLEPFDFCMCGCRGQPLRPERREAVCRGFAAQQTHSAHRSVRRAAPQNGAGQRSAHRRFD